MIRRALQIASLAVFLAVLTATILGLADGTVLRFVLGLDPALSLPTALAGRALVLAVNSRAIMTP
jgi:hypothetical protein